MIVEGLLLVVRGSNELCIRAGWGISARKKRAKVCVHGNGAFSCATSLGAIFVENVPQVFYSC